jgi:hypothetical protein
MRIVWLMIERFSNLTLVQPSVRFISYGMLAIGSQLLGHTEIASKFQMLAAQFERDLYDSMEEEVAAGMAAISYYYSSNHLILFVSLNQLLYSACTVRTDTYLYGSLSKYIRDLVPW